MWEDDDYTRRMMQYSREADEHRLQMKKEEENRRNERAAAVYRERQAEADKEREAEKRAREQLNSRYNSYDNTNSASKPKDDNYIRYIFTIPAAPRRSVLSILTSIICAVVLGGILGRIFGLFGYIGGVVGGWLLGRIIGKNIFVTLVILGVLGGGLYMARSSIAPMFSSVTRKAKPLSNTVRTVPQSENVITVIDDVNFRAETSKNSAIIKTLHQGDTVTMTGIVSGGWTQIRHKNDTGWVSSEYIKQ